METQPTVMENQPQLTLNLQPPAEEKKREEKSSWMGIFRMLLLLALVVLLLVLVKNYFWPATKVVHGGFNSPTEFDMTALEFD